MAVERIGDFFKGYGKYTPLELTKVSYDISNELKTKLNIEVVIVIRSSQETIVAKTNDIYIHDVLTLRGRKIIRSFLLQKYPQLSRYKILLRVE